MQSPATEEEALGAAQECLPQSDGAMNVQVVVDSNEGTNETAPNAAAELPATSSAMGQLSTPSMAVGKPKSDERAKDTPEKRWAHTTRSFHPHHARSKLQARPTD